ncbi:MAG: tetratricopeptide repeat protein [Aureispira sp.]|nr:tetratricopeptide repeat protein [Aureispira sp.]
MRIFILIVILVQAGQFGVFAQQEHPQKEWLDSMRTLLEDPLLESSKKIPIISKMILRWNYAQKDSAHLYLERYKDLVIEHNDSNHLAIVAGYEAMFLSEEGKYLEAISLVKKKISIGQQILNYRRIAAGYAELGNIFQKVGDLDSALLAYENGVEAAKVGNLKYGKIRNQLNISDTYKLQGNYTQALEIAQHTLDSGKAKRMTGYYASMHNLLGELYLKIQDYPKATSNFEEAIFFAKKYNNLNRLSISYELLAECQIAEKKFEQAEQNLRKSIAVGNKTNIKIIEGRALWKLANFYHIQNLNREALELALNSEQLLLQIRDKQELINALRVKGAIYNSLGAHLKAKQACINSQSLNEKTGQKADAMKICFCLFQAYEGIKQLDSAIHYLQTYNGLKDSLMNFSISREITQIEYQKKYDLKVFSDSLVTLNKLTQLDLEHEKEAAQQQRILTISIGLAILILLVLLFVSTLYFFNKKKREELMLKNELIEEQKSSIKGSLEEKEVLLKEIHHRVKNNLQIILGLLELQSNTMVESDATRALSEGKSRVKSMALIHQKLYQTDDIAVVDVYDYLKDLILYIKGLYPLKKDVIIDVDVKNIRLDIDTVIPLALILNEMLSNSFKYAFEDTLVPKISVSIKALQEVEYQLVYADNGKGLPVDLDIRKLKSLGLKLIKRLVQQLFGRFKLINEDGLQFRITFKDTALRKEVD